MAANKPINFRADDEIHAMIETLRKMRTPIPLPGDILKEAVREKFQKEVGAKPKSAKQ